MIYGAGKPKPLNCAKDCMFLDFGCCMLFLISVIGMLVVRFALEKVGGYAIAIISLIICCCNGGALYYCNDMWGFVTNVVRPDDVSAYLIA